MSHFLSWRLRIGMQFGLTRLIPAVVLLLTAACAAPPAPSDVSAGGLTPAVGTSLVADADDEPLPATPLVQEDKAAPDAVSVGEAQTDTAAQTGTVAETDTVAPADAVVTAEDVRPLAHTTNILVLGSDRRADTPNWRTDVMMIIALDQENGRAGVISIPRDVYIDQIPNHQPNRINVVDYLGEQDEPDGGGPALLAAVIQERMDLRIDHFVRFDFESFRDVVDALGGVQIDVDCEFRGYIQDEGGWLVLEPGPNRLAGNQAMIYVRDRAVTGGDLDRARRQQRFVWAVRNQVLSENLVTRIPALYSALSGAVETDLGLIKTLQYARFAIGLDVDDLYGMVIGPPEMLAEGWRDGMAVFVPDWPVIAANVQDVFASAPFMFDNTPEECRSE